ncbi:polysaccharide pyruvyl transferase family protein [Sphingomonas sp. Mn802worker]|uniref:polysaccharide pyruvyl transferase family protein n=1 Tax=Sphingomonas sp. Mn802worker TaxID=629773 RepID=UPI001EE6A646|nr:polysaccharide pyruvyl transferase family protein [Sphingomonas sp. Mn802worker]
MASPLRVGVLTFHRCINYGSYWQARCLVEGLRGRGHDAVLLDHHDDDVARAEWRCAFQPSLPLRSRADDLPRYKAKGRKFLAAFDALPQSERFRLDQPEALEGFDAVVVGSDEVWNFRHPWYGGKPIFFGEGVGAPRLVSYAASFGNHDAVDGIAPEWVARLARFTAISVRDENARRLVIEALGEEPAMVLDPCLQFPDVARVAPTVAERRYALVYGHIFPDWLQVQVTAWSKRSGVELVSVGYRNDWVERHLIEAGPIEFASLMAGASAVVTNFFHGCVFALTGNKPFVTSPSEYRFNKVRDLTNALDAREHVVTADSDAGVFDRLLGTPPAARIGDAIDALRVQSGAFLDSALG